MTVYLCICGTSAHQEYMQWLQRQRSGDVVAQLLRERAKKYAPFVRMDLYEGQQA